MATYGFVYILSNMAMPDIYKIGYTDRSPMQRAAELSNSTACPLPFDIVCYGEVENPQEVEALVHESYADHRLNRDREFFRFEPNRLIREVCINLREQCTNFTECEEYELLAEGINQTEKAIREASE